MMDRAIAERTVTPAQVDRIDQIVRLRAQACVTMPPLAMLRRLVADFNELRVLVSQVQSPATLVRLYACSAQIGALVADELMVLGETHRAWGWHHSATVAADETRLPELGLRVRSLGILIPLYSDDYCEALSMAVEACELGGSIANRSSPAYALAVTLKALILARLGFVDECRTTLNKSEESFARLNPAGKIDSVFGFSERRWRFYRARAFAELGKFDEAWEAQGRALELYPANVMGDPTIIRLDRALCLVRKNEIDAGCELAANTLSSLPPEHQASIFLGCGKKILTAVPEKCSNRRSVRQCRAVMTESCQAHGAM
jgi:tetratricopeptide (TPR) repeat protein